jgi:hypothetical protein
MKMVTRDTTKTYVVRGQIEDVERFYIHQMQRVCQQAEIAPFQVVTDTEHLQPYHQASCWIKGENIPEPTFYAAMKKFDEPESRSIVYRVINQTVQTFRIELVQRSATEVEVTHSEFFTTAC